MNHQKVNEQEEVNGFEDTNQFYPDATNARKRAIDELEKQHESKRRIKNASTSTEDWNITQINDSSYQIGEIIYKFDEINIDFKNKRANLEIKLSKIPENNLEELQCGNIGDFEWNFVDWHNKQGMHIESETRNSIKIRNCNLEIMILFTSDSESKCSRAFFYDGKGVYSKSQLLGGLKPAELVLIISHEQMHKIPFKIKQNGVAYSSEETDDNDDTSVESEYYDSDDYSNDRDTYDESEDSGDSWESYDYPEYSEEKQ